jgi:hypothetical protein
MRLGGKFNRLFVNILSKVRQTKLSAYR